MKTEILGILVDLDSLLDTRLSTYHKILGEDVSSVIEAGYYDRIYDRFKNVDYDEYRELYAKRDKTYLETQVTNVPDFIIETIVSIESSNSTGKDHFTPTIIINTWPYNLNQAETEIIIASIRKIVDIAGIKITSIDKTLEELSPNELKSMDIGLFISYNAEEWMMIQREHTKTFDTQSTPDIGLIAPKLITKETPDPRELLQNSKLDPFRSYEMFTEPNISLRFLSSELFSAKLLGMAKKK